MWARRRGILAAALGRRPGLRPAMARTRTSRRRRAPTHPFMPRARLPTCSFAAPRSRRSAASSRAARGRRHRLQLGLQLRVDARGATAAVVEHRYRDSCGRCSASGEVTPPARVARTRYDASSRSGAAARRNRATGPRRAASRSPIPRRAAASPERIGETRSAAESNLQSGSIAGRIGSDSRVDAVLGVEELIGFALSNRPRPGGAGSGARRVIVADRFPGPGPTYPPRRTPGRVRGPVRIEADAAPIGRPATPA